MRPYRLWEKLIISQMIFLNPQHFGGTNGSMWVVIRTADYSNENYSECRRTCKRKFLEWASSPSRSTCQTGRVQGFWQRSKDVISGASEGEEAKTAISSSCALVCPLRRSLRISHAGSRRWEQQSLEGRISTPNRFFFLKNSLTLLADFSSQYKQ